MALQLSPMTGITAYHDRMGDQFPELVESGRIVQGHQVSGPLPEPLQLRVDRDLADTQWRAQFHRALHEDRRFQRGLFDLAHAMRIGPATVPGPAALLELLRDDYARSPFDVAAIRALSRSPLTMLDAYRFEYGLALLKTAAALSYTINLALAFELAAVTDSPPHHALLERTRAREGIHLQNLCVPREGY